MRPVFGRHPGISSGGSWWHKRRRAQNSLLSGWQAKPGFCRPALSSTMQALNWSLAAALTLGIRCWQVCGSHTELEAGDIVPTILFLEMYTRFLVPASVSLHTCPIHSFPAASCLLVRNHVGRRVQGVKPAPCYSVQCTMKMTIQRHPMESEFSRTFVQGLHGPLQGRAFSHQLVDLPPSISLRPQEGEFWWWWAPAGNGRTIEPVIPLIQVRLGDVKLLKLGEGNGAHEECVPENHVHPLKLSPCLRVGSFLLFLLFLKAVHCELTVGLGGALPLFRQCWCNVFRSKVPNLSPCTVSELLVQKAFAPLVPGAGTAGFLLLLKERGAGMYAKNV